MPCPSCGKPGPDLPCPTCISHEKEMAQRASVMGQAKAIYLESGRCVGERVLSIQPVQVGGTYHSAYLPSTAYFCPYCGEIWAREIISLPPNYKPIPKTSWAVEHRACPEHGDGYLLVGKDLDNCSLSLLKREVELLFLNRGGIPRV